MLSRSIQFVPKAKLEKLLEAEFEEFDEEGPEARRWEECLNEVKAWLSRFSHDEEEEGADGSPGFLLEDIWQGVMTIGIEFNDPALLSEPVLIGLAEISARAGHKVEFGITFYLPGKNSDMLDMESLVIQKGVVYVQNSPAVKKAIQTQN